MDNTKSIMAVDKADLIILRHELLERIEALEEIVENLFRYQREQIIIKQRKEDRAK